MSIEPIQIEIPLGIMFQTVNCYLIPGEQLTLIDCGLYSEENWKFFQEKIKTHGYEVKDIEQVIITHEHRDHIGLLPEIMKHSNAEVRVPKVIEGWFVRPDEMRADLNKYNQKLFSTLGFPKEVLTQVFQFSEMIKMEKQIKEVDRLHFFKERDFLKMGNTDWEVLKTPGHSPTQFVFLQKKEKRIFGSDMLLPIAPMPIKVDDSSQPLVDLVQSFERLKAYNIKTVYPGHGKIYNNANAMIDKQLARIEMRKEECFEAIQSGCKTPYEINRKMYPYQQIPPDFSGMFMVLGYIDLLEAAGRISKTISEDGVIIFS